MTQNAIITTRVAYGQASQGNSDMSNANSLNVQNIPAKKVHVGDIDIAYKTFGNGEPILLISSGSSGLDSWDPSILTSLSSNHTVIVFDSRGVGNTTTGSKPYTMQQLANDTAGLMDALKIQRANVLGHSLGSYVSQQLTITYPEKVDRLILVSSSCGGKEGIPKPREFLKLQSEITNKSLNNDISSISQEEIKPLISASLGSGWIKLHPDSLKNIPKAQQLFASVSTNTLEQQANIGWAWEATNWKGACDELAKIAVPTGGLDWNR